MIHPSQTIVGAWQLEETLHHAGEDQVHFTYNF